MIIAAWVLYVCTAHHCHRADVNMVKYFETKEVCEQAAAIIEEETVWDAFCLPVMGEK